MTIGAALLFITVGAILRFAVATVSAHGVDLHTVGDILMVVGAIGLVLWLALWAPWARASAVRRRPPPADDEAAPAQDRYHDDPYPR